MFWIFSFFQAGAFRVQSFLSISNNLISSVNVPNARLVYQQSPMARITHLVSIFSGDLDSDGSQPKKIYCMLYSRRLTERHISFKRVNSLVFFPETMPRQEIAPAEELLAQTKIFRSKQTTVCELVVSCL